MKDASSKKKVLLVTKYKMANSGETFEHYEYVTKVTNEVIMEVLDEMPEFTSFRMFRMDYPIMDNLIAEGDSESYTAYGSKLDK